MKSFLPLLLLICFSCDQNNEKQQADLTYQEVTAPSSEQGEKLYAVTHEDYLQYGADVAYINDQRDTIIDFGQFAFFGTDTLTYFAKVLLHPNDSTYGGSVGINRAGEILFDLVMYDNGPDEFKEGLVRVKRNNLMGFANEKGQIVIDCKYDFAFWFENGAAKVTYEAKFEKEGDHTLVESDQWFYINRQGERVNHP